MITSPSRDLAIKYALENKWQEAYEENKLLLDENPEDIDSLNRIAYSLIKLGKLKKAKEYYKQVLELDHTNPIALKNSKRIDTMSAQDGDTNNISSPSVNLQDLYIEEAGKTKTVDLKNVADNKTLSIIQPGDVVSMVVKRSKVFIQKNDKYLGALPDSVGMRLIDFINGGNEYSTCIKAVGDNSVTVFIKETKKASKFKNQPSFFNTQPVSLSGR